MGSLEDVAFDTCVREKLLDQVAADFNIKIAASVFKEELLKSIPEGVTDENGYINMDAYKNYLSRMSMSPRDFEENRYQELKRDVIQRFMSNTFYVPQFAVREDFAQNNGKKSFMYVHIPFKRFLAEVENESVDQKALKEYYEMHKEVYRTPEKRKLRYWMLSPDNYSESIVIDDEAINNFYERNKSKLLRLTPKLKVRRLVCATEKEAKKALVEAKAPASSFKGELVDFFGRGTHDKAFEDAAFKLNNPGELSPVVRTAKGFEIIQLVERQKAETKPLEAVKDEIVKNLRIKKAVTSLRSDLGMMMHDARNDVATLEAFVKQRHFEEKESAWLTVKDGSKSDLQGMLAQKIFASVKRQQTYGYFIVEDKYVIYLLSGTEKSFIPLLDQIKDVVTVDYKKQQTENSISKVVLQIKTDVLHKKMPLAAAVAKFNLGVNQTALMLRTDELAGVEKGNQLVNKMFILSDRAQILQYRHDQDYYLAQLIESAPFVPQEFDQEKVKIAQKQKTNGMRMYSGAFIASLQRNAKIDVDKKMLSKTISTRD